MNTANLKLPDGIESSVINKTFDFNVGKWEINPTYWQAVTIVFLIFLLIFTLARVRYLYIHWSLGKAAMAMFFWGFVVTLILEGFFILSGRTILTEFLGWRNAPKPISVALDVGRDRLRNVLGMKDEIPSSEAKSMPTSQDVILDYQSLPQNQMEEVKKYICEP